MPSKSGTDIKKTDAKQKQSDNKATSLKKPAKKAAPTEDSTVFVGEEHVFIARIREPEIAAFVYGLMAETGQTMQSLIKLMVLHAAQDPNFKVEKRVTNATRAKKMLEAHERKIERYRAKAGKDTDE